MTANDLKAPGSSSGVAWWTLFILFMSNLLNVADRALLGVVTEPVRLELGLSDTQMSLANGLLFVSFNLGAGLFIARMVDRGNRKRILAVGVLGWSIATAATGYATDFFTLSLARIAVGIGEATAFPVALSMIADLFRPERRAGAVGIYQASNFAGIVGGTIAAGILAATLGWRDMFIVCGLAGVVLAVIIMVMVREPEREDAAALITGQADNSFADLVSGTRRLLSATGFLMLTIGFGVSSILGSTLGTWGPAFFQRVHNVPLAEVGLVIGPPVGIGGVSGMILSGLLADWMVKRSGREVQMLLIPLVAMPLSLPFVAAFVFSPSLMVTIISTGVVNFLLGCTAAPCVTLAAGSVAPSDRGLAATLMLASAGLLGGALGPFMVGLISDLTTSGQDAQGLRYGLSFMLVAPVVSTLVLVIAHRQFAARNGAPA